MSVAIIQQDHDMRRKVDNKSRKDVTWQGDKLSAGWGG